MNHLSVKLHATPLSGWCRLTLTLFVCALSTFAQRNSAFDQRYEITPLIGGMFGGTIQVEQPGIPNFGTHLEDRLSYGIAGGFHYDADDCRNCNFIEFRWIRQHTHLRTDLDPIVSPLVAPAVQPFSVPMTLDNFLGDFTREFEVEDAAKLRPFVTATVGAVRMAAPAASTTRFVFGLSTGLKVFPSRRWGIRFQVEYLPIVMHAELQRLICAGGCIVALSGGIMNQFQVSMGPAFRFK